MPKLSYIVNIMKLTKNYYLVSSVLRLLFTYFLMMGLVSCNSLGNPGLNASTFRIGVNVTPIGKLKLQPKVADPVYIQGKIARKVPLLEQQAYQIDDSTGKIWVVTSQTRWKEGDRVVVKGQLRYQNIPIANRELGELYLEEK